MKKLIYIGLLIFIACQPKEKKYYSTGELKSEYYLNDNGKKEGGFVEYFKDGTIKEEYNFVDGQAEGTGKGYYPSGNLKIEAHFNNNLKNGNYKDYYEDGNLKSVQNFKDDLLHGNLQFYYENGGIKMKATSRNDTTVFYKKYSKKGRLTDLYRKVNFTPKQDTIYQGEQFEVDFEIFGNLEDIEKVGFLNNGWFTPDGTPFEEANEVKREYFKVFPAKDTGKYLLNLRIWEKDTAYTKLYFGLYAKPKPSS